MPLRGSECSDAAGKEKPYADLLTMRESARCMRRWDREAAAPFFTCGDERGFVQVWYDDPEGLSAKYSAAVRLGLRGVGVWTVNFLDYANDSQVESMWGVLP